VARGAAGYEQRMQGGNENPNEDEGKEPVGVHPDRQGDEPTDEQLGGPGSKEEADAEADIQQSGP
jgi:hypothetical protein